MKQEKKLQVESLFRLLWVVVFAFLYAYGGIEMKWIRRFIAPVWLGGGLWLFSRNPWTLLQVPILSVGLHLGYGGTEVIQKIIKRSLFGLACGISPVWMLIQKNWKLYVFNIVLLVSAYIVFGVWNPFPNARLEESALGLLVGFLSIMGVKRS